MSIQLNTSTAGALAIELIAENHGRDVLAAQRPLKTIDQDETILVTGTPYEDLPNAFSHCASRVVFSKTDAEILDFGFDARISLTKDQESYWRNFMSPEQFDGVFGPRTTFDLAHKGSSMYWFAALNGGLLNTSKLVTAYATILLQHAWNTSAAAVGRLTSAESGGVWHVAVQTPVGESTVLRLARSTGRIVSLQAQPAA